MHDLGGKGVEREMGYLWLYFIIYMYEILKELF